MTSPNSHSRLSVRDLARHTKRYAKGSYQSIFTRPKSFKISNVCIFYFTSFKTFFYFYAYQKHNHMIKTTAKQYVSCRSFQIAALLQKWHTAMRSRRRKMPPSDSPKSFLPLAMGQVYPELIRWYPETPIRSQTGRMWEVSKGKRRSSLSYITQHFAAPQNVSTPSNQPWSWLEKQPGSLESPGQRGLGIGSLSCLSPSLAGWAWVSPTLFGPCFLISQVGSGVNAVGGDHTKWISRPFQSYRSMPLFSWNL